MTSVALKGILRRKTRTVLTSLAIVLGVGMVCGTFIFTDTVQRAFNGVFSSSYEHTSLVVAGKQIVTGAGMSPTVPASLVEKVRAVPGVQAAAGNLLFDTVELVGSNSKAIGNGSPQVGFGIDSSDSRFNPLALDRGSWPHGPHQIAVGTTTAAKEHIEIGDVIGAKGRGAVRRYTVTGLVDFPGVSVGTATVAAFDVPTAQAVLGKQGRYDSISVIAAAGVPERELATRIEPLLGTNEVVRTADEQAANDQRNIAGATSLVRYVLLAFAGIALFVGAFVIFNTISMTVAQRTREFATLRTIGASRRQVLRSVLLESAAVGAVASTLGVVLGLGLARALEALFKGLPKAATVVEPRTVIVSVAVGVAVTLLASVVPALRAMRVPPISAVREGSTVRPTRFARWKPYAAGVLIVTGVIVVASGFLSGGNPRSVLVPAAAGMLLLFLGAAMISSRAVAPLIRVVGRPARQVGGSAGKLASANAARDPGRTAATAAALMIGLALVTFISVLATGLERSTRDDLSRQLTSDYVVHASGSSSSAYISRQADAAIASVADVTEVSGVRGDKARAFGSTVAVAGLDGRTIGHVSDFAWKHGSGEVLASLGNGAVVDASYANQHHLSIGTPLELKTSLGARRTFVVRAIYRPTVEPVFGDVLIDRGVFDRTFPSPQNIYTLVNVRGGATPTMTAALTHAVSSFTDVSVDTKAGWIQQQVDAISQVLAIFYAFLTMSVIVSVFGMINTLVLALFERTREIGMLRAIGMSRRQVRRMVRHESIITALVGAALGLPLGVLLAAILTRGMASKGVSFHVPIGQLAFFACLAVVVGAWAAVLPSRRAARLDVLRALQYE
jgi:putative ABC transport system permease protein